MDAGSKLGPIDAIEAPDMNDALAAGTGRRELIGESNGSAIGGNGIGVAQPSTLYLAIKLLDQLPGAAVGAELVDL